MRRKENGSAAWEDGLSREQKFTTVIISQKGQLMGKRFTEKENEQLLADLMPHLRAIREIVNLYDPDVLDIYFRAGNMSVTAFGSGLDYFESSSANMKMWKYSNTGRRFIEEVSA